MGFNNIQWGENSISAHDIRISTCAGMNLDYFFTLYAKKKNPKWTKSLTIKSCKHKSIKGINKDNFMVLN